MIDLIDNNKMKVVLLINKDNMKVVLPKEADLIYADMIYENLDFSWVCHWWKQLRKDGIFIIQTDYHSSAEIKVHTQTMPNAYFLNWLIWKNEFGNFKKDRFRQCHDDILIFCKGKNWKWYPERVQIEKATAKSKGLNPSGRTTKLATSVIADICLTTISNERIHKDDGHCVRWQKPLVLLERIFSPFVDAGDLIVDPFMGVGSSGLVAEKLGCNYVGIEIDSESFELAKDRLLSK